MKNLGSTQQSISFDQMINQMQVYVKENINLPHVQKAINKATEERNKKYLESSKKKA
jgi:predicted metallo-beta-lactamase superfamily hydrolase